MDQPALVDAFPVLGEELPVRSLLHGGMVLFATDKTFHETGLLINQFCGVLFLGHIPPVLRVDG
jgi:hypothetical protein